MNKRREWGKDYTGQKFSKLTVIGNASNLVLPSGQKPRRVVCQCECGKESTVLLLHLTRGRIKSCGCIAKTLNGESKDLICRAWKSMKDRCKPNYAERHLYFDKGIIVCDEWANDYFAFKKWALENNFKPHLQLDRIDGNKGYSPDNCRFVTPKINGNNRADTFYVTYNNQRIAFMLLIDTLKIPHRHIQTIRGRIKRGWEHQMAIDTPIRKGNYDSL